MAELKKCPFCGGEGTTKRKRYQNKGFMLPHEKYGQSQLIFAGCFNPNCEVKPNVYARNKKQAIEAWNRRTKKW